MLLTLLISPLWLVCTGILNWVLPDVDIALQNAIAEPVMYYVGWFFTLAKYYFPLTLIKNWILWTVGIYSTVFFIKFAFATVEFLSMGLLKFTKFLG